MPAKSKEQQRLFGMVHAYQKGELKNPSEKVKDIADSISYRHAKAFAKTKHKGLPNKVKSSKKESINIKDLNRIISESIKKVLAEGALQGEINVAEFYVNKKAKEISKYLDSIGGEFMEQYEMHKDPLYEYFASMLWGLADKVENVIRQYNADKESDETV